MGVNFDFLMAMPEILTILSLDPANLQYFKERNKWTIPKDIYAYSNPQSPNFKKKLELLTILS